MSKILLFVFDCMFGQDLFMYVTLLIWVNTVIIARKYTIKTLAK